MDNQTTIEIVFNQLDLIEGSIKEILELWEVSLVPINLIEKQVKKGMIDLKKADKEFKEFYTQYNNMLKLLIDQCKKDAKEMEVTQIPMELFSAHINNIKTQFQKSAKEVQQ